MGSRFLEPALLLRPGCTAKEGIGSFRAGAMPNDSASVTFDALQLQAQRGRGLRQVSFGDSQHLPGLAASHVSRSLVATLILWGVVLTASFVVCELLARIPVLRRTIGM